MPVYIYRSRFIIAISLAIVLLLSGCVKNVISTQTADFAEQYFLQNILTRTFVVEKAVDDVDGDITSQFTDFSFVLDKQDANTIYYGPVTGTKGSAIYTGTWSLTEDYGKLTINFTNLPAEFSFLNRAWKFTEKSLPTMKLAPWGSTAPDVLWMRRL